MYSFFQYSLQFFRNVNYFALMFVTHLEYKIKNCSTDALPIKELYGLLYRSYRRLYIFFRSTHEKDTCTYIYTHH